MVKDLDRLVLQHGIGEKPIGHVRSAPWAVDGEEAQADRLESVEMRVAMRHQLVGLLGGGIEADGMVDRVVFAEGDLLVAAVDAGAGGIDQALDFMMPATFQNIQVPRQIGLLVSKRVLERIAHTRLRRQVADEIGFMLLEVGCKKLDVRQITPQAGVSLACFKLRMSSFLERNRIIVVEIVQPNDLVAILEQCVRDV